MGFNSGFKGLNKEAAMFWPSSWFATNDCTLSSCYVWSNIMLCCLVCQQKQQKQQQKQQRMTSKQVVVSKYLVAQQASYGLQDREFNFRKEQKIFLISNFCPVLNVVSFLLGSSPASEFYKPTFRNTLSLPSS